MGFNCLRNYYSNGSEGRKNWVKCFGLVLFASIICILLPFVIKSKVSFCSTQRGCNIGMGHRAGKLPKKKIDEASGLAVSNTGLLWTHNDDRGDSRVFGLDSSGDLVVTVELDGVDAQDWEDIAVKQRGGGGNVLYVADTGDNKHKREHIYIYSFSEPDVTLLKRKNKKKRTIHLKDFSTLEISYPGSQKFDNEALAVDPLTGDIFLFTKNREQAISHVFRYPSPQSPTNNPFVLEHVTSLPIFWVTGGDISPDGQILVLTNKQEAFCWNKTGSESWMEHLTSNPEPCSLQLEEERQREAVAVTGEGIWTTSEGKKSPIWFYPWVGGGGNGTGGKEDWASQEEEDEEYEDEDDYDDDDK